MRNQLEVIFAIDKYLRGVLDEAETQEFENRLKSDTQLQQEVAKQELLMEGIKRSALKASAVKGKKKYKTIKTLKFVGVFVAVAAIAVASVYFAALNNSEIDSKPNTELGIEALPTQGFELNTEQDTVIETENGSVFVIPADAFETENGEAVTGKVTFEIKEAFEDIDIMKAGLTTTSDGKLLETGGMFFLDATQNGQKLRLKKGKEILSQLPDLHPEKNMMLFDGEFDENGIVNWVNPKEFEKDLITVDITSLDFYPEGYVEEIANPTFQYISDTVEYENDTTLSDDSHGSFYQAASVKAYKNEKSANYNYEKSFTDSLYYSFARLFHSVNNSEIVRKTHKPIEKKKMIIKDDDKKYTSLNGKALFKQNCASCHNPLKHGTGPALVGSKSKWESAGDDIYAYIRNPQSQIDKGVRSAIDIMNYSVTEMSGQAVTNEEIDAIYNFIEMYSNRDDSLADSVSACPIPSGINPAKVKAIWNKKFNNTILATYEFEERMKVIHESHQDRILKLYVSNLDKPLWYSDSVAMITYSVTSDKFRVFYNQRKGGVKVKDRLANKLTNYFNKKHKEFTSVTSKAYQEYERKKQQLRAEFANKKSKKDIEEFNRKSKVFQEEYEINKCEAYTQAYKNVDCNAPVPRITASITSLGPKNLDVYVFEATRDRKTMNYTDPNTGGKATLVYEPIKAKITNSEKFDKVFVYLLPDSLSSFNRMKTTDNINFDFSMNMLFQYKLMAIGYKGKQAYLAEVSSVSPKEYSLNLSSISENELKKKLKRTKSKVKEEITSDRNFYEEEMVNNSREKKYYKNLYLTLRIGKFLFPEVNDICIADTRN